MIVDTSAVLAVVFMEEDWQIFSDVLRNNMGELSVSPINLWEAWVNADRSDKAIHAEHMDEFQDIFDLNVINTDLEQAVIARDARRRYGKGSKHPAKLNLGDCFAYALAKSRNEPLLFKGNDFQHTDIEAAI